MIKEVSLREDYKSPFIEEARQERLTLLLYRQLKRSGRFEDLPPLLARELKAEVARVTASGLRRVAELKSLLLAFQRGGIPVIPLRGPALAEALYGDPAARPMGDLDLLVQKANLARAIALLKSSGYRTIDSRIPFAKNYGSEIGFYREEPFPAIVELHWSIGYPPLMDRIEMEAVWKGVRKIRRVGVEAYALSPEDLLVHLSWHIAHRQPEVPFLWIYELALFLEKERTTLDWGKVLSIATSAGIGPYLYEAFTEANQRCGAPVPASVLEGLAHARPRRLMDRIACRLATASAMEGREALSLLLALPGISARLNFLKALLLPSPEYMRHRYGLEAGWRLPLVYLKRWGTLPGQAVAGLLVRRKRGCRGAWPTARIGLRPSFPE